MTYESTPAGQLVHETAGADETVLAAQAVDDGPTADDTIADEVLVDEVSIDGMCGVY